LFTYPNCDDGNKEIIEGIQNFKSINPSNSFISKSLGQKKYLSALNNFDIVIGNSSSGIIEASFFNIKVLNIGNRQKGRTRFGEVFESNGNRVNIKNCILKILSILENKKNHSKEIIYDDSPSDIILNALA
jgi:UDP-N-acetylglucosamine 2-epimerase